MNPIVRNILAVVAGAVIGTIVNSGLISLGPHIIAPPEGADMTTMEGLAESMHLFSPKHFIFPFLAHALGTLVGALVAAKLAATSRMTFALVIGGFFLLGGIAANIMIPAPTWFKVVDLVFAYIPMGYLAGRMVVR